MNFGMIGVMRISILYRGFLYDTGTVQQIRQNGMIPVQHSSNNKNDVLLDILLIILLIINN